MNQTYQQTLDFLYKQLPMFQRVGNQAFKKDLNNTLAICEHLDNPYQKFKSIHVGGTNGKGSTSHIIAAVLQAHGFKVGMYTSPHYKDFRERIKINGKLISKKYIVDFVEQHKAAFGKIQPSFFEWTVGLAFDYFANQKVDIAIIEVGLGGRLDSTNVITPLLSVITNISFDHTQFLGDTLPLIAGEKAGIIKKEIPIIIGETHKETAPVFKQTAEKRNAPILFADKQLKVDRKKILPNHQIFDIKKGKNLIFKDLELNLIGEYQQNNLSTALAALLNLSPVFPSFILKKELLKSGLKDLQTRTRMMGRWQKLGEKPLIIADSGHNEGGLKLTMKQLENISYKKLHFVLGAVNDKSIDKMLSMLPKGARYYFAKANIPRGLDAKLLKKEAAAFGLNGRTYSSVRNALRAAKRAADSEDMIFIGGSTFVVAEAI